jgi:uncharacterized protein (DUF2236 family)
LHRASEAVDISSVSWRVNAERMMLFGWGRAILLQVAHPLIAAGVYEHSSFRSTPLAAVARLRQTVHAMLSLTFGSDAQRERTLEGIRRIHRRVNGELPETVGIFPRGTPYSAERPELLLWVHTTLLESILLVHDIVKPPLALAERDSYCADAAPIAVALGVREADVPRRWVDVQQHLDTTYASGAIAVGFQGRELAGALVGAPALRLLPFAGVIHRTITVGLLPPHVRDRYQLVWQPRDQRRLERLLPRLRTVRRWTPEPFALWKEARG